MAKLRKYLLYALILTVWGLFMFFPYFAFQLATEGQYTIGSEDGRHVRAFLLSDKETQGIGWEFNTPVSDTPCNRIRVRYTVWEGDSVPAEPYCNCTDGVIRQLEGRMCVE